jgi:hypothetical protein
MTMAFFNVTRQFLMNILPQKMKMDFDYFAENINDIIIGPVSKIDSNDSYPRGRKPHERGVVLYFDNAPIHTLINGLLARGVCVY